MRILNASAGDPTLLDSKSGLRRLHDRLAAFLRSEDVFTSFPSETAANPNDELLNGLRVSKTQAMRALEISADRWLELSAPVTELESFAGKLLFQKSGHQAHWYSEPVSLIIEVDERVHRR
jgi:hypothetical protein